MSNMDAIFISISKEGWLTLEHYREMVASFFANSPASHFLFSPCSTNTIFSLFIFAVFIFGLYCKCAVID